jgi:hypothetical protein
LYILLQTKRDPEDCRGVLTMSRYGGEYKTIANI